MPVSHAVVAPTNLPVFADTSGLVKLLAVLASVPDPRARRGVRYRLAYLLAVAVVTVLGGASNFREIGDQAADLPQEILATLGARHDRRTGRYVAPSEPTLRRAIGAVDAECADRLLCGWVGQLRVGAGTEEPMGIAMDGKTLRGSGIRLFAAVTHRQAIVLAQVQVPDTTTEATQVAALLDPLDLAGKVVSADAAHTSKATAGYIVGRDGDYVLPVKGNTPALLAQVRAALSGVNTVTTEPDHCTQHHCRGQIYRRSLWIRPAHGVGLPHAAQVFLIRRDVFDLDGSRVRKQYVHGVTSQAAAKSAPDVIAGQVRDHWTVENRVHYVRDVTWREDANRAYTGDAPRMMAALRNLALSVLNHHGTTKIKATLQRLERNPEQAIALLNLHTT